MIELIVGTYGLACWLVFKKFKLVPVNTYTIFTAIGGGVVILVVLFVLLSVYHPVSHDGRMYTYVVQIVPNVRGTVVEVPVEANKSVKQGEVLFRIDPQPFQIEVDRLQALLASKNVKVAQLSEQLAAAEAATSEAQANLLVAESTYDRQAREAVEQAAAQENQVKKKLDLAAVQLKRAEELRPKGAISQEELDRHATNKASLEEELKQARSAKAAAEDKLKTGSASLEAVRQEIVGLEAAERELHLQIKAESDGVNPEVREVMAQLDKARWDLEQSVVRAPSDGYVPQITLQPGQMAVPMPLKPLMVFVVTERPALIASFKQKTIPDIKEGLATEEGLEAEAIFKAYPGRSYKLKVRRVMTAMPEGEILASGELLSTTAASEKGYVPIVFDYYDDIAALELPAGAQASIAIYTHRVHALSIVRKIILRMKSWENYLF
jgi:multidrug resistance efflux pump